MMKAPSTSEGWVRHFAGNVWEVEELGWGGDVELTESERRAIEGSIQAFQLGEGSDGARFLGKARRWGDLHGDPGYGEAVAQFIAEENRHSEMLGRFMDGQGIPRIERQWSDGVFRWMRSLGGMEVCVRVLVAAEVIAAVYYRALREATDSPVLVAVCTRILWDEAHHLIFQGEAVSRMQAGRGAVTRCMVDGIYRLFMAGVIGVVWLDHGRAMRAGGYTFTRFVGEVLCELEDVLLWMKGEGVRAQERAGSAMVDRLLLRMDG